MQTHVGPPFRCDATQSPGRSAASSSTGIQAPALHASTALSLLTVVRLPGSFRAPQGELKDRTQSSRMQGDDWKKLGDPENQAVLTALLQEAQPSTKKQTKQQQHDVCYRDWYLRVPTCTAAQLGLYVFARHSGRRVWCVQSRVGHLSSRHLQAQRSWSELQLSQQLLPSEEWGRIQGMLRCHNALIELINTLHGHL